MYLIILILYLNYIYAVNFNIINRCEYILNLYSHESSGFKLLSNLEPNSIINITYNYIHSGLFKHTLEENATLFEFSINEYGIWYDISVIPPGSGNCYNYDECRQNAKTDSYNIPIDIYPINNNETNIPNVCIPIICHNNKCSDAYLYPFDDFKMHYCPLTTEFNIVYCNNNIDNTDDINIYENTNKNNNIYDMNKNKEFISVCKDATYSIHAPGCSGSGIFPNGYNCPQIGDTTEYDCTESSINYNNGKCIVRENGKCIFDKDNIWKCIYPSIGCN